MRLVFPARINAYGVEEMRAADTTPPPPNSQLSTPLSRSLHSDGLFINIQLLAAAAVACRVGEGLAAPSVILSSQGCHCLTPPLISLLSPD